MLSDMAAVHIPPRKRPTGGRKAPARVDARSLMGRYLKKVRRELYAKLGGRASLDEAMLAGVERASEVVALAWQARGKVLRGEPIELREVIRIEALAERYVTRLLGAGRKLKAEGDEAKADEDLHGYLSEAAE